MSTTDASLREAAAALLGEIDDLIGDSQGVYGLHLNGDPAPWDEIVEGGRFERLSSMEALRAALAQKTPVSWAGDPSTQDYASTAQQAPASVLIETDGTEWGVRFVRPNGSDYVACATEADARRLHALAAQQAPAAEPVAGWKLVPVDPTQEMVDATYHGQPVDDIYRDMLAAAPQPPQAQPRDDVSLALLSAAWLEQVDFQADDEYPDDLRMWALGVLEPVQASMQDDKATYERVMAFLRALAGIKGAA